MSFPVLVAYESSFPACVELLRSFQGYFSKKLYNELSIAILKFIYHSEVKGKVTFEFYSQFVKKFEKNIDPINLLKMIKQSIALLQNEKKIEFLQAFEEKQAFTEETKAIVQSLRGSVLVACDIDKCSELVNKVTRFLENRKDVDPFVYSTFYKFGMGFYSAKRKHKLFYSNALQFMAYTPEDQIEHNDKVTMLIDMALACLVSDQIYNFSELLEQPLLLSLKESSHSMIYELLEIFNEGSIVKYENVAAKALQGNETLKNNESKLQMKIRLMAFLELAFNLPKNDRVIAFDVLARKCGVENDQVELMVMKAMALSLVKGSIDQLARQVTITWVAPKVLGKDKIGVMLGKFEEWSKGIENVQVFVDEARGK